MKRYLVFSYAAYYPGGGWSDFQKSFDDRAEAMAFADTLILTSSAGVDVIDLETELDIYVYPQHRET